ncbi:S-4TM family putative pore-forming effector [Actinoplanes sp. NPDC051470]|uniref:S-4TM family putative pore-forming effector n=1 Tax=Actinoplanes sp. NPDC051470 TaxID=3157224 RepID=UPI00341E3971
MMRAERRIDLLQNDARSVVLLRAIAVTHRNVQRVQAVSLAMSLVIAGSGIVARITDAGLSAVAVAGTLWAALYALVLAPSARRYLRTSATLQELLDTTLFNLPWNSVLAGDPLSEEEVSRLSRRYRGDQKPLLDYYLVSTAGWPYDVLFCFEQNLAWGSRVRRRLADGLIGLAIAWCVGGVAVAFATEATVTALVSSWLIPSLGLLLFCSDQARAQNAVTQERSRVLGLVRAVIDDPTSSHLADEAEFTRFARQVQDSLLLARRQQPRTPQWFFRLFHDDDLSDFRYKMRALEKRITAADLDSRLDSQSHRDRFQL